MNFSNVCSDIPFPTINYFISDTNRIEKLKGFPDLFETVRACHAVDEIPRNVSRMKPEERQKRITERQVELVRVKQSVRTGFFDFKNLCHVGGEEGLIKDREVLKKFMGDVIGKGDHRHELNAYVRRYNYESNKLIPYQDCMEKGRSGIKGDRSITLVAPEKMGSGDCIGFYNNDNYLRLLIANMNDDPLMLEPLEGAVFDTVTMSDSGLSWRLAVHYCRNKKEVVDMNPLLRWSSSDLI
ncbi:hypothetical protein [Endozoicomonas atrinae]|uniref:hypothetical protein n=1 Tax=Endozoicomonas atrinae TaxID=1333660 RepID=UPI003AFFBABB